MPQAPKNDSTPEPDAPQERAEHWLEHMPAMAIPRAVPYVRTRVDEAPARFTTIRPRPLDEVDNDSWSDRVDPDDPQGFGCALHRLGHDGADEYDDILNEMLDRWASDWNGIDGFDKIRVAKALSEVANG